MLAGYAYEGSNQRQIRDFSLPHPPFMFVGVSPLLLVQKKETNAQKSDGIPSIRRRSFDDNAAATRYDGYARLSAAWRRRYRTRETTRRRTYNYHYLTQSNKSPTDNNGRCLLAFRPRPDDNGLFIAKRKTLRRGRFGQNASARLRAVGGLARCRRTNLW